MIKEISVKCLRSPDLLIDAVLSKMKDGMLIVETDGEEQIKNIENLVKKLLGIKIEEQENLVKKALKDINPDFKIFLDLVSPP